MPLEGPARGAAVPPLPPEDHYAGATIQAIAADAHVDPALVRHDFGTKQAPVRLGAIAAVRP